MNSVVTKMSNIVEIRYDAVLNTKNILRRFLFELVDMKPRTMFFTLWIFFLAACTNSSPRETNADVRRKYEEKKKLVEVVLLKKSTFPRQYISNGTLSALQKSDLRFGITGQIDKVFVSNGSPVKKGQVIARLAQTEILLQHQQAQTNYQKAKMDFEDALIGQGYALGDTTAVPKKVYYAASIRSGHTAAKSALEEAEFRLEQTVMKAPFTGVAANIAQKQYEQLNGGEAFCKLVDLKRMEVAFQLTETEIREVVKGDSVKVYPLAHEEGYGGVITELNPIVDEHGLIQLKAVIENPGHLMDGMNVKVIVEKQIPDQLVVPKSAVVLRQNQEVLFKVVNGKAYWTYVHTGLENSMSFTVKANTEKGASLDVGDTVIVSGNLNLAHESNVTINHNSKSDF